MSVANDAAHSRRLAGIVASAALCGLYARGGAGWALGFVALVPWLRAQDAPRSIAGTLFDAWAMTVAYTLAVFWWFAGAVGAYTGWGTGAALVLLLVLAPALQPQFLAFALARRIAGRRQGVATRTLAAACAWLATEWLVPRLLGDTLGQGLYPSRLLRQAADVGGTAGLTFMLLLANEAAAAALARRTQGRRAIAVPLALAAAMPALLAAYGAIVLAHPPTAQGGPLRVGMVQADIVDYERLRRDRGAAAVVRDVLDTHFAMSYDAVERRHADAVLWPETVYPTTLGHPKSAAGAALDREILDTVDAARVPFVIGTYDADAAGEYNAAAFVEPGRGIVGVYRKTRLFPFTERVPAWLDGPALRRALPWAGRWQPGDGARVFPLFLADGREVPVAPLICRDDLDPALAIDAARLGAQALLAISNDAWFAGRPQGAALHRAAAAFRSVETRLPQFRATTSGLSAAIDATGTVVADAGLDARTLVVAALPVGRPPRTLVVAWGDWVGPVAAAGLALMVAVAAMRRLGRAGAPSPEPAATWPVAVCALPPVARVVAGALRAVARAGLLWMIARVALGDPVWQGDTIAQVRVFAALFLVPEAAAWCVLRAFAATASVVGGHLVLARGARRLELPLREVAAVVPWRLPIPGPGVALMPAARGRASPGIAVAQPLAFARALADAGAGAPPAADSRAARYAQARAARRPGLLDRPAPKFLLLPLALAIPAFRLHQHIAYGSGLGEFWSFGLSAYATGFALWWAAWTIAVALCAAALRAVIEAGTVAGVLLSPAHAGRARRQLERLGLAGLYLGLPAWLLARLLGG
ncbi:MAG: apolipoprotein N-acyltransferase [Burkholderiaceae bacterium]